MSSTNFSVGSYNVLNPYHAVKWAESAGLNEAGRALSADALKKTTSTHEWKQYSNWEERKSLVAENIRYTDIVCLQEIAKDTLQEMAKLSGYQIASAGFHQTEIESAQFGNAILFNPEKIKLIEGTTLEHTIGTEDASWDRSAACALFNCCGRIIKVASVHLSGYNPSEQDFNVKQQSKLAGYHELESYAKAMEKKLDGVEALIIAGDFNEDISEAANDLYRPGYLQSLNYFNDSSIAVTEPFKQRKIDWIFYKSLSIEAVDLHTMDLEKKQAFVSDHLMTGTKISCPQ